MEEKEKDSIVNEEYGKKKRILTSIDKNNYIYYNELNSRDPKTYNQPIDYYDLLKQQIKYYKELNTSLKEEIETVKKCKKLKQLEQLNDIDKLASGKEKDEINNLISSNNYSETNKMRQELNQNELKITDLETKNRQLEESVIQLKNTLDRANEIFPNLLEKLEKREGGLKGTLDFQASSNFNESKITQTRQTNIKYGNSCSEEQCYMVRKELKRLEEENQILKSNIVQLNKTIQNLKLNKNVKNDMSSINLNKIEGNGEIIIDNNININHKEELINGKYNGDLVNENMDKFNNKLFIDNKRLATYIEKIEQFQKMLNEYKIEINSLNEEIKLKDEKIKVLINNLKEIKNGNSNAQNENEDVVNKDINEMFAPLEKLNKIRKECERLKNENELLIKEKQKREKGNGNGNEQHENNINENDESYNINIKEYEEKIRLLVEKNKESENMIKDFEIKNQEANKQIELLNQQIIEFKNQLNNLNNNIPNKKYNRFKFSNIR